MRWMLLVVLLLGACTSATGGRGSAAPLLPGAGAPSGSAGVPSASSASSASSAQPSATAPTSSGSSAGALDCPPGSITATGAPFCYPLPTGFTDFSVRTDYGSGWTYRTLIGVGGPDLVEVLGSLNATSFDTLTAAQLRAFYDRAGLITKGSLGFVAVSAVGSTTVDGARAFVQDGRYSNGVAAHLVRAFLGRTIVFVSCQSRTEPAKVAAACATVLAGLKIART